MKLVRFIRNLFHKRKNVNKKSIHEILDPHVKPHTFVKRNVVIKHIERDEKGRWIVKE